MPSSLVMQLRVVTGMVLPAKVPFLGIVAAVPLLVLLRGMWWSVAVGVARVPQWLLWRWLLLRGVVRMSSLLVLLLLLRLLWVSEGWLELGRRSVCKAVPVSVVGVLLGHHRLLVAVLGLMGRGLLGWRRGLQGWRRRLLLVIPHLVGEWGSSCNSGEWWTPCHSGELPLRGQDEVRLPLHLKDILRRWSIGSIVRHCV